MPEPKLGVALVKEACRLCGKMVDGPIIMNTRLTEGYAKKVEEMHGECIGYLEEPCADCKDHMSKGFLLIGVDEDKTEDRSNPWRTGQIWVIKPEAAERMFDDTSKGAAFIDQKVVELLGLPAPEESPEKQD